MGSGFSKMKKQAKLLEEQMSRMQDELKNLEVTGEAANGLVKIVLTGEKEVKSVQIAPECVDPEDVEGLQDLIMVALNDGMKKIDEKSPSMNPMGGLPFGL